MVDEEGTMSPISCNLHFTSFMFLYFVLRGAETTLTAVGNVINAM